MFTLIMLITLKNGTILKSYPYGTFDYEAECAVVGAQQVGFLSKNKDVKEVNFKCDK